ncbi:MAG: PBP1A family penicillin-binding protein [Deltaproteobacteria bacterium]|nr:PBP1A family penicillin-binding protein [Deltaproteobacteria bacterium]
MAVKKTPGKAGGKKGSKTAGKRGGSGATWVRRVLLAGVAVAVVGCLGLAGLLVYYSQDLPSLDAVRDFAPKQMMRVLDRQGAVIGEIGEERRTVVPFAEIPPILVKAVVAAEDTSFYENAGLDVRGIARAFIENVIRGRTAQGGSTITQQVVKRLLLTPERTLARKFKELILAYKLTKGLSKNEIMEIYLNQIYYGHGRYGCEEASQYFFGKSVRKIDDAEAALLAGLPQSPERLSPLKHPEAAKTRQRYVLGRMAELGALPRERAELLAKQPIKITRTDMSTAEAPEAMSVAQRVAVERLGDGAFKKAGGTVQTTIDLKMQGWARDALEHGLEALDARQGYNKALRRLKGPAIAKFIAQAAHEGLPATPKNKKGAAAAPRDAKKDAEARRQTLATGQIVEAVVTKVEAATLTTPPRLFVDAGHVALVVDLSRESRYAHGKTPLTDRFAPGDVVRVQSEGLPAEADAPLPAHLELGPQAAMVVLDVATGEIRALVGGYGYRAGQFDRSQQARRQPGSAFKPFVYAKAIETRRFTAASVLNDAPEVYDLWKPKNYEKEAFRGPVRLRVALAHSINTVAIRLLSEIGVPALKDMAVRVGITSPITEDMGLSLALGSLTVTPLELAQTYLPFFNGGQRMNARLVTKVVDQAEPVAPSSNAMDPETAFVVLSMMKSVVLEGTARAATALGRPVAGKTGTSNGQRDAWFAGATADLLAVVWVGFDDMEKLGRGETGGGAALPIWIDFMTKASAGQPVRDFSQPAAIEVQTIDPKTGLLAAPGTEGVEEVFLPGTAPKETAASDGEGATPDEMLLNQ